MIHPKQAERRAHAAVQKARQNGTLCEAGYCEGCGLPRAESPYGYLLCHHWSYEEAHRLDVIFLCDRCHARVHAGLLPEPRTGRVYPKARERPVRHRRARGRYKRPFVLAQVTVVYVSPLLDPRASLLVRGRSGMLYKIEDYFRVLGPTIRGLRRGQRVEVKGRLRISHRKPYYDAATIFVDRRGDAGIS